MAELATLGAMYMRGEKVRVVPFDLRSFAPRVGPSVRALATVLPLLNIERESVGVFALIARILGKFRGCG